MGDRYLRQLIVVGMTSRLRQVTNHPERADPWLTKLLQRRPTRLATVAMANKTARIMWAVLTRNEPYRPHTACDLQKPGDSKTDDVMVYPSAATIRTLRRMSRAQLPAKQIGT